MKVIALIIAAAALTSLNSAGTANEPQQSYLTVPIVHRNFSYEPPLHSTDHRASVEERKTARREESLKSMPSEEERFTGEVPSDQIEGQHDEKNLIFKAAPENRPKALIADQSHARAGTGRQRNRPAIVQVAASRIRSQNRLGATFAGYEEAASWSVSELGPINEFFLKRFGRALPVSALGQSHTHDRLGLDHRESVDVAVRPDSVEGRELLAYLRRMGIPFRAFRGKLSSVSTGAHIHIGRPSPRLATINDEAETSTPTGLSAADPGV